MAYVKFNIWFRKNKHYTELFITQGENPKVVVGGAVRCCVRMSTSKD